MNLEQVVQSDDRLFDDSPDAGLPECICSRCGQVIGEETVPIRLFVLHGAKDRHGCEYRYHPTCVGIEIGAEAPNTEADFYYDEP